MRATRALLALDSHQCGTSSGSSAIARSMSPNGTIDRDDTYLLLCMKSRMLCSPRLSVPCPGESESPRRASLHNEHSRHCQTFFVSHPTILFHRLAIERSLQPL